MNFLKRLLFRRPTVSRALASLSTAVRKLDEAEKAHTEQYIRHLDRAGQYLAASTASSTKAHAARDEAARAARVRENIDNLLK